MATPLVAGCAADLREALIQTGTTSPSAALIKALLVNGAVILTYPMSSSESGFGRVNLTDSISIVHRDDGADFYEGQIDDTSQTPFSKSIAGGAKHTKLKITLVWSDPPGQYIQNSLLLNIQGAGGFQHQGNVDDNVQQVLWDRISPGEATVTVTSVSLTTSSQRFAVVWRFS